MSSTNTLNIIWTALKPILKLVINVGFGVFLARKGILNPVTSKGLSKIIVNFLLPCLLFSKMVTSINVEHLSQMGMLACVVLFYIFLGALFGLAYRLLLTLPKNFRNGFVAASIWANWGDLPLAVMSSVGDSSPFKPGDSSMGVAYMSVLIVMFNLSLFTLGGYKLVQHDYKEIELDEENEVITPSEKINSIGLPPIEEKMDSSSKQPMNNERFPSKNCESEIANILQKTNNQRRCSRVTFSQMECSKGAIPERRPMIRQWSEPTAIPMHRKDSSASTQTMMSGTSSLKKTCTSIANFHIISEEEGQDPSVIGHPVRTRTTFSSITDFDKARPEREAKLSTRLIDIVSVVFSPPNIAIIAGITIGLIDVLKGMWVRKTTDSPFEPPLEFLFQVITMVGTAYLPLSLANLGGALAKFNISAIPLYISLSFVVVKLVITPIIGISTVQFLTYTVHWIPEDDKPLRFLAMFASCVPTATSIMVLSQFFSPTGEAKEVANLLVFQYMFGMITMVGALVYILKLLSI
ncbi:Protein M3 [Basidiobolus ranarum]|uniref:Protein M3 n=1 Tax=Basidiobolus ranarum TaxID=34480 RepID=A0ABR2W670_9FUNG